MGLGTVESTYQDGWHGDQPDGAQLWREGILRAQVVQVGSLFIGEIFGISERSVWEPIVDLSPLNRNYDGYQDHTAARKACGLVAQIVLEDMVR